jgi:hypothetical protein
MGIARERDCVWNRGVFKGVGWVAGEVILLPDLRTASIRVRELGPTDRHLVREHGPK